MVRKPRVRRYNRSAGLVALLAVVVSAAGAQVTTELSEQAIAVGERVSYIITIDHEEPGDVEVPAPDFPGLRVVQGPTIRPVSLLVGSERERAVEVRFELQAESAGRYVLPAIPVAVAGQPYLTVPRLIEIGLARDRTSVPFLARWSGPDESLYSGQARVYTLEIFNVADYLYPSSVSLGTPGNAILEEVQGLGTIEQYSVDGVDLYTIPVALFMVTASSPGTLTLPAAEVVADSLSATAEPKVVPVQELPTAVQASGAVGAFSFTASIEPTSMLRSETAELRVRVAGRGNLHFLGIPEPELDGFQVEYDETERSMTPTERGYEGLVERVLRLRPAAEGPYDVRVPDFAFLDPDTDRVQVRSARTRPPVIADVNQPLSDTGQTISISLLDRDELAGMERLRWYSDPLAYGWFVPGVLVLVASRIWRRKDAATVLVVVVASLVLTDAVSDRLAWDVIDRGYRRYAEDDLPAAISAFERAARTTPDSPGLNHNLAVLYFQVGDIPRAVLGAREAVRLAPFAESSRGLLATIEAFAGVERTVSPPHVVHPDLFFMIAAALVNALFVIIAFAKRGKAAAVIATTLIVVLIAGSIAGLVVTAVQHERQLAVVIRDITLRRIPEPDAAGWLSVSGGAAVRVLSRNEGSLLVQTAVGLEGWVNLDDVLWNGIPAFSVFRYRGFLM